eukprot:COSAG01_NODE_6543_length_3614_cov_8.708962_4_plen_501_part_00
MLAARARGVLAAALVLGAVAQHEVPGKCEGMDKNDEKEQCDKDPSNGCGAPEARAGPQAYAKCMEVRLVLAYNGNVSDTRYRDHPFPGDTGKEEGSCVVGDEHGAPPWAGGGLLPTGAKNCPLDWNCNIHGICRNGLYCGGDFKCHQCARCFPRPNEWKPATANECGNCKTAFYPSVDEYSSLQVMDNCAPWPDRAACRSHFGCDWTKADHETGGSCVPGPILMKDSSPGGRLRLCLAENAGKMGDRSCPSLRRDTHTIFVPHQQMFLEVGAVTAGHGIVRSPIVVLSDHKVEVEALYVKIGLVGGYPRKLVWEQTATINPGCDGNPEVKVSRSGKTVVESLGAPCNVPPGDDDAGCNPGPGLKAPDGRPMNHTKAPDGRPLTGYWPATECGFSTLLGSYKEGNFNGMVWPKDTDVEKFPQADDKHTDCSQHMCGLSHDDARAKGVLPAHIFVSWTGEDVDGRDMSSGGLSYQSFHAFSVCLLALPTTAARVTQLTCPSA